MLLLVEGAQRLHHLLKVGRQRKRRHIKCAEAVFGLQDDRVRCRARKCRFANTRHAVHQDARRLGLVALNARQRDGHYAAPGAAIGITLTCGFPGFVTIARLMAA
jgi:hypothetical protein